VGRYALLVALPWALLGIAGRGGDGCCPIVLTRALI
jgi:hypothetical protein